MIISSATKFLPPSSTTRSAFFLLGSTNCSCMGLTVARYWQARNRGFAALCNVAADAADKADISVRIHKDLDIHLIAQGVVLEDQDTLDQNDLARLDRNGFARAGIGRIVVDGHSMLCPAFSSFKLPIIMSVSKASG